MIDELTNEDSSIYEDYIKFPNKLKKEIYEEMYEDIVFFTENETIDEEHFLYKEKNYKLFDELINYFQGLEEYEKCAYLLKIKEKIKEIEKLKEIDKLKK